MEYQLKKQPFQNQLDTKYQPIRHANRHTPITRLYQSFFLKLKLIQKRNKPVKKGINANKLISDLKWARLKNCGLQNNSSSHTK